MRDRKAERTRLLRELFERRKDRTALREGVARELSEKLGPDIRVTIAQHDDRTAYRAQLNDAFRGSGKQYGRLIDAIVARMPPHDFARQVMGGAAQGLVEQLDIDGERASWLVGHLRGTTTIYDIEAVELNDVPRIELKDGLDYKDSSELSTGQKCTTILPILLLESEKPLLIDQPEDNLDNAFIYHTVVRKLRELKKHRQLIFVTHNPNIPVLGDAGQVIVLTSSGRLASVEACGTVDDVKGHVAMILEGGQEAFTERRKRYGY
jgi:ATPase subunit of ABC transporter with duplicated ATPase domains